MDPYTFAESFWGNGFATEAASAVVAWAIAQPSIRRAGLSYEATLACWEARPQLDEVAEPNDCYALTRSAAT